MKNKITFDEFLEIDKKLEIKMGTIKSVTRLPKSNKMLQLTVSFGDEDIRTVLTNIGNKIEPINLEGIQLPFITNLEPANIMGVVSEAMIMVGTNGDTIEISDFSNGSNLM